MLTVLATIVGTITQAPTLRMDKNNCPYLSFPVSVTLPDSKTVRNSITVRVNVPNAGADDVSLYPCDSRVCIQGDMDIRKRENGFYSLFMTANLLSLEEVSSQDSITGKLSFRGHLRNENFYEVKTDRNGNSFLTFTAYSSEKVGNEFVSTWVNFLKFPEKNSSEPLVPIWFQPKQTVNVTGDLQLSSFNNLLRISCRVAQMSLYVKPQTYNN